MLKGSYRLYQQKGKELGREEYRLYIQTTTSGKEHRKLPKVGVLKNIVSNLQAHRAYGIRKS